MAGEQQSTEVQLTISAPHQHRDEVERRLCRDIAHALDTGTVGEIFEKHHQLIVNYYRDVLPSSVSTTTLSPPPSTQKIADGFCERYHLHKVITNNGKSWRCRT
jgi:hypothetical protein